MSRLILASVLTAAEAGTLSVTYQDCGAKHGVVTGLSPLSVQTGSTTTVTGTGTVDEVVTSGHFTATVSALGAKLTECSGDGTSDIVCNFPLNVGSVTLKALSFPLQKGTITIPVEVTTSALIPTSLANVDIHVTAEDQNGESAICLDVHTAQAVHSAASACTSDEQGKLADPQTVGDKANTCGTSSYNILTGKFNHDKFNSCFSSSIGISTACSECYAATGEYGAKNCKADCLLGWCKSGCLSCTEPAQETLATCTGFTAGTASPCEELKVAGGACTSDEQGKLADPQTVGTHANTCGTSSYNILTGKFNHDKFNSCFTSAMGISTGCAECYAATGEYGAKNCKASCLLGWCKSGCLSCTEPAQEVLSTCTGFTAGTAAPCEELKVAGGACTSDEQAALADPQTVGDKANTCGTSSYNIITGNFNHDKFNSCFSSSIGISTACSECYAATGEYGAKNCKASCILGWCKSGCLSCTEPAQETLATCTGFTAGTADPCETTV